MAQVVVDRPQNVGELVGRGGVAAQLVVAAVKFLHGLLLMAEYLDYLLAVDHLFDVAVYIGQGLLLLDEVFAALPTHPLGDVQHQHCKGQHKQRQPQAQRQHGTDHRHQRNHRGQHLRKRLGDHLAQGVGVVGEMAHHLAMAVRVKVADGQRLHMSEHLVAHILEHTLRHGDHQPVVEIAADHAHHIDADHHAQGPGQAGKNGIGLQKQRGDIIVDQHADKRGAEHAGHGAENDAQHHQHQPQAVARHIAHQPANRPAHILGLDAPAHSHTPHHSSSPPFIWDSYTSL